MRQNVPDNDPSHPRWLLDIKNWRVHPYKEVASDVEKTGYGIVSYTWGMWADFDKPAEGLPENILWNIPTVEGISLAHAREVLDNAMNIRFVWWDWMCVPQGKRGKKVTLDDDLEQVKGEEIAKQMYVISSDSVMSHEFTDRYTGQYTKVPERAPFGCIARAGTKILDWERI